MGWFDEQIRERKAQDNVAFEEAFLNIAGAVLGERLTKELAEDNQATRDAVGAILQYYHIKQQEIPLEAVDINDQLECLMRPYGIMRRTIRLDKNWHKRTFGALLGSKKDGGIIALIPGKLGGYYYYDPEIDKNIKITQKNIDEIATEAICFYRPFPLGELTMRSIIKYILQGITLMDFIRIINYTAIVTIIGALITNASSRLIGEISSVHAEPVIALGIYIVCVSIGKILFEAARELMVYGITMKLKVETEAATFMRILSLPARFFRQFTAGELNQRLQGVNQLCDRVLASFLSLGVIWLFSIVYVTQISWYAPGLALPSFLIVTLTIASSTIFTLLQTNINYNEREETAQERGISYAILRGIQKIRQSGAEKRAFAIWGNHYAREISYSYNANVFCRTLPVVNTAIGVIGTIVLYYFAGSSDIPVSNYYAFLSAYGMLTGTVLGGEDIGQVLGGIPAILKSVRPLMETLPEIATGKKVVTHLSGAVEFNNLSFRYDKSMPMLFDNISVRIRPGEYVAIVGPTGCGKSTLLRLLLGFESPQRGAIYYDGRDLNSIDLKSLRRKIGVVLQDSMLFAGSIYSNISIAAPGMTMEEAWKVAEMAELAEDIRRMPMGMHTLVQEGGAGMSGGQRQRLMIASAIAPKPKILFFDEATSALDNLAQKKISLALDKMKNCTKIIVAHRLSTIRNCDRILVLNQGKIVEEGKYDQLMARRGFFYELVARQRLSELE